MFLNDNQGRPYNITIDRTDILGQAAGYMNFRLELNIKFECPPKVRLSTKIINDIKKQPEFQDMIRSNMYRLLSDLRQQSQNHVKTRNDFGNRWATWIMGNSLLFRLDIDQPYTDEQFQNSFNSFFNIFLRSKSTNKQEIF